MSGLIWAVSFPYFLNVAFSKEEKPLVEQAMPMLIELMKDNSVVVKDTAAWTIGRVCELIPEAAINPASLQPLLEALVSGLASEPRVASNVCWAFTSLADAAYEQADCVDEEETPATYCLSAFFSPIVEKLLWTTDREDGGTSNLRGAAYEALMEMVKNSPKDCYDTVQKTTLIILQRLQQVLQMENHIQSQSDRVQFNDLQSLLCATLQSVLRKVEPAHAPAISDSIMTALLQMFQSSSNTRSGGVQEDALMAVATLVEVLGDGFMKYMDAFKPFLLIGLKNVAEYQVCHAAVGLVGDICRAMGNKLVGPFTDEVMEVLLTNLRDNNVHRTVKPQILSVFGDVALAIGPEFRKYLELRSNSKGDITKDREDLWLHRSVDVVVSQVGEEDLHHLISERSHQLVAHGAADVANEANSCMAHLVLSYILQANQEERLEGVHVFHEPIPEHLDKRGDSHESVLLHTSTPGIARRLEHLQQSGHDRVGDGGGVSGLHLPQDRLQGCAEERLQVVELDSVALRLDVALHLQHLLEPLQDDQGGLLNCVIAVLWRILYHLHQSFIGSSAQVAGASVLPVRGPEQLLHDGGEEGGEAVGGWGLLLV